MRRSVSTIPCCRRRGVVPSRCRIVSRLVAPAVCLVDLEALVACFERDSGIWKPLEGQSLRNGYDHRRCDSPPRASSLRFHPPLARVSVGLNSSGTMEIAHLPNIRPKASSHTRLIPCCGIMPQCQESGEGGRGVT